MDIPSICRFADGLFSDCQPSEDYSNNGLQVEASRECRRVAFAVDACLETIRAAAEADAQLLMVHHGLSWGGGFRRLSGIDARRFSELFTHGVSLYACHLPLDAHPIIGNNAVLARRMGLEVSSRFASYGGVALGTVCTLPEPQSLAQIADNARAHINPALQLLDFSGDKPLRTVAFLSGSGGSCIEECAGLGVDCLITGEFSHSRYHLAKEAGVSVIIAGHYATEDTGIRELMKSVRDALHLETIFIDAPTGL